MMNYVWVIIIFFSFFCAIATSNMSSLSSAVISGGTEAITLVLKLSGILCFWNGLMAIAEKSGLTQIISNLLKPIMKLLFPKLNDEKAKNAKRETNFAGDDGILYLPQTVLHFCNRLPSHREQQHAIWVPE